MMAAQRTQPKHVGARRFVSTVKGLATLVAPLLHCCAPFTSSSAQTAAASCGGTVRELWSSPTATRGNGGNRTAISDHQQVITKIEPFNASSLNGTAAMSSPKAVTGNSDNEAQSLFEE
ncbi:hypothetical protein niasHT_004426 [Heterodera trifolii]|uniref:Secreted protein n=1 Tax=Heterodera trifolii TaxID=157864 RepID=A0ABD2LLZ4_9BILA